MHIIRSLLSKQIYMYQSAQCVYIYMLRWLRFSRSSYAQVTVQLHHSFSILGLVSSCITFTPFLAFTDQSIPINCVFIHACCMAMVFSLFFNDTPTGFTINLKVYQYSLHTRDEHQREIEERKLKYIYFYYFSRIQCVFLFYHL